MFDFFNMVKYRIEGFKSSLKQFFCKHNYISYQSFTMFGVKTLGTPVCSKCGKTLYKVKPWHEIEEKPK